LTGRPLRYRRRPSPLVSGTPSTTRSSFILVYLYVLALAMYFLAIF
jgi:hypothetical protein